MPDSYEELRAKYECQDCFEVAINQAKGYRNKETGMCQCLKCYEKESENGN